MNKLEEVVKSTTGETRKALDELVHALADSIRKNKMLEQQIEYIKQDNQLLKKNYLEALLKK